jgi:hypothetical protein
MLGQTSRHFERIESVHLVSLLFVDKVEIGFAVSIAWYQSETRVFVLKDQTNSVARLRAGWAGWGWSAPRKLNVDQCYLTLSLSFRQLCCTLDPFTPLTPRPCVANIAQVFDKHALLAAP